MDWAAVQRGLPKGRAMGLGFVFKTEDKLLSRPLAWSRCWLRLILNTTVDTTRERERERERGREHELHQKAKHTAFLYKTNISTKHPSPLLRPEDLKCDVWSQGQMSLLFSQLLRTFSLQKRRFAESAKRYMQVKVLVDTCHSVFIVSEFKQVCICSGPSVLLYSVRTGWTCFKKSSLSSILTETGTRVSNVYLIGSKWKWYAAMTCTLLGVHLFLKKHQTASTLSKEPPPPPSHTPPNHGCGVSLLNSNRMHNAKQSCPFCSSRMQQTKNQQPPLEYPLPLSICTILEGFLRQQVWDAVRKIVRSCSFSQQRPLVGHPASVRIAFSPSNRLRLDCNYNLESETDGHCK